MSNITNTLVFFFVTLLLFLQNDIVLGAPFPFISEGEDPLLENKPPTIVSFDNKKLFPTSKFTLIAITNSKCIESTSLIGFIGSSRIIPPSLMTLGEISAKLVKNVPKNFCPQIAILPRNAKSWNDAIFSPFDAQNLPEFTSWVRDQTRIDVGFRNHLTHPVDIFWYEEGKEEVIVNKIEPSGAINIGTFISHIFVARKRSDKTLVNYWIMNGDSEFSIDKEELIECDANTETCKNDEYEMMNKAFHLWYEKRKWLNFFQPKIVSEFTSNGYKQIQLPQKTWEWLREFYESNVNKKQMEEQVGPCLNQYNSPTYLINLSSELRQKLFNELQPVLENWANQRLVGTSCYGIRQYTNGSVLQMHVDTCTTHVISAIVNVAQEVNSDWPLQIVDHQGRLNELAMQPGDMVLYESAKALHGRTKPLDGELYANVFLHFMPVTGWDFDWM